MRYGLGVDLGTSTVAAAVARADGVETVMLGDRSVVAPVVVHAGEDGVLVTGDAAERRAGVAPDRTVRQLRRRLGEPTPITLGGTPYRVTELLAAVLRDVVAKVATLQGGPPDHVVLSRPAHWGPTRVALLTEVARLAGLPGATTVSDPEAAALRYAEVRGLRPGEQVAVYDLGGGTFDSAVLRRVAGGVELVGLAEGIERLGGTDFDDAILAHLDFRTGGALSGLDQQDPRSTAALARLREECVLAKESLSVDAEAEVPVYLPGRHEDVLLTRAELEAMMRAPVESTIGVMQRALRSARVSPADLRAVVLVGGSTRIPLVAAMVREGLGGAVAVEPQAEQSVALGAATVAWGSTGGAAAPAGARTGAPPAWDAPGQGAQNREAQGRGVRGGPGAPPPQGAPSTQAPPPASGPWPPGGGQPPGRAQQGYGPPQAWPDPGRTSPYGPPPGQQGPAPRGWQGPPPQGPPSWPAQNGTAPDEAAAPRGDRRGPEPRPAAAPTPEPEPEPGATHDESDWQTTSIGRTLAVAVALLAVAVAVGVIVFVLLNRVS
ncbi:MAG: Hsp70 family protein [Pseudonocardia sp.]|nr:Hsp70 family protein [Pseudonocardia sp.]